MRFVSPLSETEIQALSDAREHGEKPALRRRAHAILLSNDDHTINQISEMLAVRRDTVARWLDAWERSGLDGLTDKERAGRPAIYDEQDRERLKALVTETPHQIKTVQARLQQETGKASCTMTIRRALKKAGL